MPLATIRDAPEGTHFAAARDPGAEVYDALAERAQRRAFALQLSHGGCALLADARIAAHLDSLSLSGADLDRLVLPPKVRALRLSGGSGSLRALLALPLEILAIDRGAFDTAPLVEHPTLAALSLANLPVEAASVGPRLRAIRTIGVPLRTLDVLRSGLALERVECARCDTLESIEALAALPALRELGLEGCWRLDLHATIASLQRLPLRGLRIDIGGRRKNVEVDKRLKIARLTPFPTPESPLSLQEDGVHWNGTPSLEELPKSLGIDTREHNTK